MNTTRETLPVQQTPEQLQRLLEVQLASQRHRREKRSGSRVAVLVAGIVFILIGAGAALFLLDHILRDLRSSRGPENAPPPPPGVVFGQP